MSDILQPPQGGSIPSYETVDDLNVLARTCPATQFPEVSARWAAHIVKSVGIESPDGDAQRGWYNFRILRILSSVVHPRILPDVVDSLADDLKEREDAPELHRLANFLLESMNLGEDPDDVHEPTTWMPPREEAAGKAFFRHLRTVYDTAYPQELLSRVAPKGTRRPSVAQGSDRAEVISTNNALAGTAQRIQQARTDRQIEDQKYQEQERIGAVIRAYKRAAPSQREAFATGIAAAKPEILARAILATEKLAGDTATRRKLRSNLKNFHYQRETYREDSKLVRSYRQNITAIFQTAVFGAEVASSVSETTTDAATEQLNEAQLAAVENVHAAVSYYILVTTTGNSL